MEQIRLRPGTGIEMLARRCCLARRRSSNPAKAAVPARRAAGLLELRAADGISVVQRQACLPASAAYPWQKSAAPYTDEHRAAVRRHVSDRLAAATIDDQG